jgi:DNA replication protein DnaC
MFGLTKITQRFIKSDFEGFIPKTQKQADLKKYLLECLKAGFKDNIIITGGVGIGKTHLAYAIVNALEKVVDLPDKAKIYTCDKVVLVSASDLLKNIRKLWDKEKDEVDFRTVEEYKKIPLLIIDEIGVQYDTKSERLEMFEIINTRYGNELPTIILSNYDKQTIEKTLGKRAYDRLYGGAKVFNLDGVSQR